MAYDIDTDYQYLCTHLAILIASVGGDDEAVETMTHTDLRALIMTHYNDLPSLGAPPYGGRASPDDWTPSEIASSRIRFQKYDNARKFIFYRDLLNTRMT